jgi:hypothetical protein
VGVGDLIFVSDTFEVSSAAAGKTCAMLKAADLFDYLDSLE